MINIFNDFSVHTDISINPVNKQLDEIFARIYFNIHEILENLHKS